MPSHGYKVFTDIAKGDKAKKLNEAVAACKNVLKTSPNDATTMHALGLIECNLGHVDEAIKWFEKALLINPVNADVLYHSGLAMLAIDSLHAVTEFMPHNLEAFYHLGIAYAENGQVIEAEAAYQQALKINPNYAEVLNNLGNIYNNQDKFSEAIACYHRAIQAQPAYAVPYNNMGLTMVNLGKLGEAERHYHQALSIQPRYPEALNNLGIVFRMRGQFEESKKCLQQALSLRAEYPEALNNIGNAYKDCGDMQTAITYYHKALQLNDSADYRHNLALALLAAGKLQEGFAEYELRWATNQLKNSAKAFPVPEWRGEEAMGKTLLITSEQGFGDSLQFCRYAQLAKERGIRVVFEVPTPIKRILASLKDADYVVARGETLPPYDLHCPMMSLPFAFKTTLETIPAPSPYLFADERAIAEWKDRLATDTKKLRVGLVWAGSSRMYSQDLVATDRRRSLSPDMMMPLLNIPDISFYSLQKIGDKMPASYNVIDHMDLCNDFADTAALVSNLDLIISVDTAMAHLVGALGKPVWMLNRFDSCWRWLQNRNDSPWYPTLRQFRQTSAGDWSGVMTQVYHALEHLSSTQLRD